MKRITFLICLSALLSFTSCRHQEAAKEKEAKFLISSPLQKDTMIYKDYVCQIHAISHIEIRSQEKGYLQNVYADEGQFVRKGQLMFQIMPVLYEAEMEKAKANVSF